MVVDSTLLESAGQTSTILTYNGTIFLCKHSFDYYFEFGTNLVVRSVSNCTITVHLFSLRGFKIVRFAPPRTLDSLIDYPSKNMLKAQDQIDYGPDLPI